MPTNTAAWLGAKKARLEVGPAPFTPPHEDEIVVKNHAVAVNPLDWLIQVAGVFRWIRYPFVLGSDLAGEVVEVGAAVTLFAVGDRVLGHAVGTDKSRNTSTMGAFQDYTVVLERLAAPIPDEMSYEDATVLPLALSTAACGLFQADQLALRHPTVNPEPAGEVLLVWGGSTSVGSNAIQLAVAAGYEVMTTCSPQNIDYVTRLGASQAFDYRSATVVADLVAAMKGRRVAGALAIGAGSAELCLDVIRDCEGNKFVSMASPSVDFSRGITVRTVAKLVSSNVSLQVKARVRRIRTKFIFGSTLADNEVSRVVYRDFLPAALAEHRYFAAPPPRVVGTGLDAIQSGLDAQRGGVSAVKVVISL